MFYFGVDYYPEHWPEARWAEDAKLMAEANINLVRLAEFAWSRMEPQEGRFDFDWLDRAIETLAARDIKIVLGTPTASPPPWLMAKQPDLFRVDQEGRRLSYGNRREYCPNNALYREHSQQIVSEMAEHFKDNPSVIGWQIDNEFGDRCYCELCRYAFQDWLRTRYESLDELNIRWGTAFWSHEYSDWSQIPTPVKTGGSPNPGLALDFDRFASDSYIAYQKMQVDLLRGRCPDHFITHNLMGFHYGNLNYFDLAEDLDFISWDVYWRTQWDMQLQVEPSWPALGHDTMRGLKGENFWVMEQQSGPGGWESIGTSPRPGELRLWGYQSIAHGADAIVFFRWRTARFGTEEYWHGVLDHHGVPGRRYEEIRQMGVEIHEIGEMIRGSRVEAPVACLLSYDSRFAFQIQPGNPRFDYPHHFHSLYRAFYDQHVPVDILTPTADLSPYKIVVAPALHIVTQEIAKNLEGYVRSGGVLLVTPRTGVKDLSNAVVDLPLPGLLSEMCGVEVEEYVSLSVDQSNEIRFSFGSLPSTTHPSEVWCDVLQPTSADVLARYTRDFFAGKPAITINSYGKGQVVYLGTLGGPPLYETIAWRLMQEAGVEPVLRAPKGVEVGERRLDDGRLIFLLNHSGVSQVVPVQGRYIDLLHDSVSVGDSVRLAPFQVAILREA